MSVIQRSTTHSSSWFVASIGALGIVFGDIGTSPLYTFKTVLEAYVKARYSKHFEISREALVWVSGRVEDLLGHVGALSQAHLDQLKSQIAADVSPL